MSGCIFNYRVPLLFVQMQQLVYNFKWTESSVRASKKTKLKVCIYLLGNLAKRQKPLSRVIHVKYIIKAYRVAFFL